MSDQVAAGASPKTAGTAGPDRLSWEALGEGSPAAAFRRSLRDLLLKPARFFGRMAVDGGLHEPLTFFAVCLGALLIVAFPAALSYFGLTAPEPGEAAADVYKLHTLPARITGLLLVLLPLVLVVADAVTVVLGSVFRLPGRLFGEAPWEATVSIWLYSCGAAMVPLVAAAAVVFALSLAGFLIGLGASGAGEAIAGLARWCAMVLLPLALLVGLVALVRSVVVGCREALHLDRTVALSFALSGLIFLSAILAGCIVGFRRWGFRGGFIALAVAAAVAVLITVVSSIKSRRAKRSE
ncbi:MAG: hypothetical protein R6X33_07280 [Candidatus Brocadiia bacterium]